MVAQLGAAVERLLLESGMSEDELIEALDLKQPTNNETALSAHAPRR